MEIIGKKIRWIDVPNPTERDLAWLKKEFKFHPILIEELANSSARAKVESFGNYLYLIYHFTNYDPNESASRRAEIDFLITKNEVISVRYDDIDGFSDFKRSLKDPKKMNKAFQSTFQLTHQILLHLIAFHQRQLDHVQRKVDVIASELFRGNEGELLKKISYLKRDISEYQLIVRPQQHLFNSLLENGVAFWGPTSRVYLADLAGDYLKLVNRLESYREAVSDFEATNNQLMNVKTNEIMRTFTVLAFTTFPLMLIAALFTMRTGGVPFENEPAGFWIVLGIMAAIMCAMFFYFRKRRWL